MATLTNARKAQFFRIGAGESVATPTLDADDFDAVASAPVEEYDGGRWLRANPCFRDENAAEPISASRFILCRDDGVYFFLRFDDKGETAETRVDFRADEPVDSKKRKSPKRKERAVWGAPEFFTAPNGERRFVVSDSNGEASIYSFPDGKLLKRFELCDVAGNAKSNLVVADDGETFFSACSDGSFKRWSTDGELLETLDLPLGDVDLSLGGLLRPIDVSADGKRLFAADESGKVVVWDVDAKQTLYEGREPADPRRAEAMEVPATTNFISAVYRIDDERFATFGFNDRWRVWDLSKRDENGEPAFVALRDPDDYPTRGLRARAVSPSRRFIACSSNDHKLEIYDADAQRKIAENEGVLKSQTSFLTNCVSQYVPAFDRVLVGTFAYRPILAFDPETLRVETEFEPYRDLKTSTMLSYKALATSFAILDDGDEFAAALTSGDVCFFKNGASEPTATIEKAFPPASIQEPSFDSSPALLAASPNGSLLLGKTLCGDEFVLWNWKTRSEVRRWKAAEGGSKLQRALAATCELAFLNDDEALEIKATGAVVRWNVKTGEAVASFTPTRPRLNDSNLSETFSSCRLSNDRKRLAIGYADGFVSLVDVETGDTLVATADWSKKLSAQGEAKKSSLEVGDFYNPNKANGFGWARDDSLLCVGFSNGKAVLLETRYFTPHETFVFADANLESADAGAPLAQALTVEPFFTRDDKLITVDSFGFVKRWDFRPSPEKETVLDSRRGANCLLGTSRPNVWAGLRDLPAYKCALILRDGDRELCRRENLERFQRSTEPGSTRETFLALDKDGVLSAFDESGSDVRLDFDPNLNAPKGGFVRVCFSPDRRTLAGIAKTDGALRVLTRSDASRGWRLVERPTDGNSFVRLAFRPDSKEFAAASNDGAITFVSLDENCDGPLTTTRTREKGALTTFKAGELVYSSSGKYLFQTGIHDCVWIWNVEKRAVEQQIELDLYERVFADCASVSGLAAPNLERDANAATRDAFVVAATDGALRFYRFNESSARFEQVYLLSQTTLSELIESDEHAAEEREFERQFAELLEKTPESSASAERSDSNDEDAGNEIVFDAPDEAEDEIVFDDNSDASALESIGEERSLFWRDRRHINCLSLSDDQKTLYVGSHSEVYSFDLDEIRRNIAGLSESWRGADVEKITGLRFVPNSTTIRAARRVVKRPSSAACSSWPSRKFVSLPK